MWDIVWVLPQGHRSVSVSRHFVPQAPQCPCSMHSQYYCLNTVSPSVHSQGRLSCNFNNLFFHLDERMPDGIWRIKACTEYATGVCVTGQKGHIHSGYRRLQNWYWRRLVIDAERTAKSCGLLLVVCSPPMKLIIVLRGRNYYNF